MSVYADYTVSDGRNGVLGVSGLIRPTVTQAKTVLVTWLQPKKPSSGQTSMVACFRSLVVTVLAQTLYLMVFEISGFPQKMVTSIFHIDLHSYCRIFPQGDLAFNLPPLPFMTSRPLTRAGTYHRVNRAEKALFWF